jgi:hypothetical protein
MALPLLGTRLLLSHDAVVAAAQFDGVTCGQGLLHPRVRTPRVKVVIWETMAPSGMCALAPVTGHHIPDLRCCTLFPKILNFDVEYDHSRVGGGAVAPHGWPTISITITSS